MKVEMTNSEDQVMQDKDLDSRPLYAVVSLAHESQKLALLSLLSST